MTEDEWLACADPSPMVRLLWEAGSKRKLRLFAVACCRRVVHLVPDPRLRASVSAVEGLADGLVPTERLEAVAAAWRAAPMPEGGWLNPAFAATCALKHLPGLYPHDDPAGLLLDVFELIHMAAAGPQAAVNSEAWQAAYAAEQRAECLLLRDIFGPLPFRPIVLDPSWLCRNGATVRGLAEGIYDEWAFDRLPILGDALEEAGCANAEILDHCRHGGPHVRGCWVVDLILGKG
jgi:hypothetical protein